METFRPTHKHSPVLQLRGLVARYATVACLSMLRSCNAPLRSFVSRNLCCMLKICMSCACMCVFRVSVCVSTNTDRFAYWQQTSEDEGNVVTSIDLLQSDRFCKPLTSRFIPHSFYAPKLFLTSLTAPSDSLHPNTFSHGYPEPLALVLPQTHT